MKGFLVAVLLLPTLLFAQELDANVSINTDRISAQYKDKLVNFTQDIKNYINNNRYTGEPWQYAKIKCNFTIFFESASEETRYTAQVNINSIRSVEKSISGSPMLNVLDNSWSFTYEHGQSMYFNQSVFDPLTSFLDFYAYIIIGLDNDSYDMLSGTRYFNAALDIAMLGTNSQFSKGWDKGPSYSRRGLVEDLVSEKYRKFRENFLDYHYNGLDLISTDRAKAQENMAKLIKDLEVQRKKQDLRGVLLQTFFNAKVGEITNCLSDYSDKIEIFAALKRIDPGHISKYDEALSETK